MDGWITGLKHFSRWPNPTNLRAEWSTCWLLFLFFLATLSMSLSRDLYIILALLKGSWGSEWIYGTHPPWALWFANIHYRVCSLMGHVSITFTRGVFFFLFFSPPICVAKSNCIFMADKTQSGGPSVNGKNMQKLWSDRRKYTG